MHANFVRIFFSHKSSLFYLRQPPTIHPVNLIMEGSSMTILCIAMGTPMPTISLYISGRSMSFYNRVSVEQSGSDIDHLMTTIYKEGVRTIDFKVFI
jgi:hypothetical protein